MEESAEEFINRLKQQSNKKQFFKLATLAPVTGKCKVCGLTLMVKSGQLVYTHKECRKYRNNAYLAENFAMQKRREMRIQNIITPSNQVK